MWTTSWPAALAAQAWRSSLDMDGVGLRAAGLSQLLSTLLANTAGGSLQILDVSTSKIKFGGSRQLLSSNLLAFEKGICMYCDLLESVILSTIRAWQVPPAPLPLRCQISENMAIHLQRAAKLSGLGCASHDQRLPGGTKLTGLGRGSQCLRVPQSSPEMVSMPSLWEVAQLAPRRESIYADAVERTLKRQGREWGFPAELYHPYINIGLSFSSYAYPSTVSEERLEAASLFNTLYFLLDDVCFDRQDVEPAQLGMPDDIRRNPAQMRRFWERVNKSLRDAELRAGAGVVERILWGVACRLRSYGSVQWYNRFVDAVELFSSTSEELKRGAENENSKPLLPMVDLEAYTSVRCRNSGGPFVASLMEGLCDCVLPEAVRAHPCVDRLFWICVEQASFVNDIFSYHKDVVLEGNPFNLIKLFMERDRLSFPLATRRSLRLIQELHTSFERVQGELPTVWPAPGVDNSVVQRYVQGLREIMAGNYFWSQVTYRYRSPDSPFSELTQALDVGVRPTAHWSCA